MKLKRGKLLVDPPTSASSDIAFILIIFFLVCASVQPETGLGQNLPKAETQPEKPNQSQNIEVGITPSGITLNGNPLQVPAFRQRITAELAKKTREADKVVVVTEPAAWSSDGVEQILRNVSRIAWINRVWVSLRSR